MKKFKVDFNSPVILGMAAISLTLIILSLALGTNRMATALGIYYTSWADPLMYLRMVSHIFVHGSFAHLTGNFMLILAVGPMVEEKYGSSRLALMILITAAVTGLVNVIFFKGVALMGASGVAFMLILLASFVNIQRGHIPLTVILAAVVFIGNEIVTGMVRSDNISQMGHIIGGLCGGAFGFYIHSDKFNKAE